MGIAWDKIGKVAILGAGESGLGAAILAKKLGIAAFVSDRGNIKPAVKAQLSELAVPFEEGQHDTDRILGQDLIIKSPGIPDEVPLLVAARAAGRLVISEIEFASHFTSGYLIGITGSNGKTTTTKLTHHLLQAGGLDAACGGNVGNSFAALVAERDYPYYVLEISSFQLDNTVEFRPHLAMILNITPDHLDRYGYQMERYIQAKFNIVKYQQPEDVFLYPTADPNVAGKLDTFSPRSRAVGLALEADEFDHFKVGDFTFDLRRTALKGRHNAMNARFAAQAAIELGLEPAVIQAGFESFVPVPHRLERVATVNGATYYNDSKATNVDAVFYALEAMTEPTVWILGGQDKGNDYSVLLPLVKAKVKAIVALGADNSKIMGAFEALGLPLLSTQSATAAVAAAAQLAQPGDAVLLSPACASFDLFKNYEDRGNQFREAVLSLPETSG